MHCSAQILTGYCLNIDIYPCIYCKKIYCDYHLPIHQNRRHLCQQTKNLIPINKKLDVLCFQDRCDEKKQLFCLTCDKTFCGQHYKKHQKYAHRSKLLKYNDCLRCPVDLGYSRRVYLDSLIRLSNDILNIILQYDIQQCPTCKLCFCGTHTKWHLGKQLNELKLPCKKCSHAGCYETGIYPGCVMGSRQSDSRFCGRHRPTMNLYKVLL